MSITELCQYCGNVHNLKPQIKKDVDGVGKSTLAKIVVGAILLDRGKTRNQLGGNDAKCPTGRIYRTNPEG